MQIEYSKKFIKEFKKCPVYIQDCFKVRLKIFIDKPNHSVLHNHPLIGKLNGYRSFNINSDWRAIFEELETGKIVYFIAIGTHSQLYS